jgi:hypothetical protein
MAKFVFRRPECDWPGCKRESMRSVKSKSYCSHHFDLAIHKHLLEEYEKLDVNDRNPEHFMNVFGIWAENRYASTGWPVYLSRARMRDRTYNVRKTKDGFTFCIVRHFGAWSQGRIPQADFEQIYKFTIEERKLELVSQDPDDDISACAHAVADAIIEDKPHPVFGTRNTESFGEIRVLRPRRIPEILSKTTKKLSSRSVKRFKEKVSLLVRLYSEIERVDYRGMLAFKKPADTSE